MQWEPLLMDERTDMTDYTTGATRRLWVIEIALMVALCIAVIGYVLIWGVTEPWLLGSLPGLISPSVETTLGWVTFLVVVPVYVLCRFCVDWSFFGVQVPGRRGLVALAASAIIWVGTEVLGVRSYGVTIVVLAALIVGLLTMVRTMWAVDEAMIRDAVSELFDQ